MPTNFSTIGPLSASTISRPPSFVKDGAQPAAEPKAEQPVASSSIYDDGTQKKKSNWFLKTILAAAVIAGGLAAAKKYVPQVRDFVAPEKFSDVKGFKDKALYVISKGGEKVIEYSTKAWNAVKGLFSREAKETKPQQ